MNPMNLKESQNSSEVIQDFLPSRLLKELTEQLRKT